MKNLELLLSSLSSSFCLNVQLLETRKQGLIYRIFEVQRKTVVANWSFLVLKLYFQATTRISFFSVDQQGSEISKFLNYNLEIKFCELHLYLQLHILISSYNLDCTLLSFLHLIPVRNKTILLPNYTVESRFKKA